MTTLHLSNVIAEQNRSLLERLVMALRARHQRHSTRRALLELNDHLLADIGLDRASILAGQD